MAESSHIKSYKDSLKSLDTEEHIDLFFYRPIGYVWTRLAMRLGVKPNAITIAAIFLGLGAAVAFYFPDLGINVIGMLLLVWANSFDSADGQLARLTGQYSRLGRILDGLCGDIWFVAIYLAIIFRELNTSAFFSANPWTIWLLAVVTGICHAKQAAMADYYRQFHLYFLKGEDRSELDTTDELRRRLKALSWRRNFFAKLSLYFYSNYTANQEVMTPAMQKLRHAIRTYFPDGKPTVRFRHDFRQLSLPLMKYTNILSFNWRCIALFASLFIGQPWLYFVFELVVLNNLLVYMMLRHESICRQMLLGIESGDYAN
ncbi:MAG: CDP-alcohol phosphatidyltransferase family protein [Bacteroidales bacterium]|nr:CDP-alcohol phosphatidyltransferase family protein [Bacteroidales bacterium]